MTNCGVALPVMNGGQRIPSTNGFFLDVGAAVPAIGLFGDLRVTTTSGFFRARLDLRFVAMWFLLTIFVTGKVTGAFLDYEAVSAKCMLGAVIYLGRSWP